MKWLVLLVCVATLLAESRGEDDTNRGGRIVAAYSTRTILDIKTTTATVVKTCNNAANTAACQRRRLRRYRKLGVFENMQKEDDSSPVHLESALDEVPEADREGKAFQPANREGRIALTVWTTTSSTYTITSTSTNTSTTFSISYYCSLVGGALMPSC